MVLQEAAKDLTINLAGMEFVTISETVDLLSKIFGSVLVKREPAGLGDFVGVRTDIEKTKKTIRWVSGNVL